MRELAALQIISLAVLNAKGITAFRLEGNRDFNDKNIKSKMKSLKEFGQLKPAIMIDAKLAAEQGLKIVDFRTGEEVTPEQLENGVVLVDGNHKLEAHYRLLDENEALAEDEERYEKDFYLTLALNQEMAVIEMLTEINTVVNPWKGGDWAKGAALSERGKEFPLIELISKLTSKGYSAEVAAKFYTGNDGCGSAKVLQNVIKGNITNKLADKITVTEKQVERGQRLLDAARSSFSDSFLKSRTMVDWIFVQYGKADDEDKAKEVENLIAFLSSFTRSDVDSIEKAKGKKGVVTKEQIVIDLLNKFYKRFSETAAAANASK